MVASETRVGRRGDRDSDSNKSSTTTAGRTTFMEYRIVAEEDLNDDI
jgi:hypothetical protein